MLLPAPAALVMVLEDAARPVLTDVVQAIGAANAEQGEALAWARKGGRHVSAPHLPGPARDPSLSAWRARGHV